MGKSDFPDPASPIKMEPIVSECLRLDKQVKVLTIGGGIEEGFDIEGCIGGSMPCGRGGGRGRCGCEPSGICDGACSCCMLL